MSRIKRHLSSLVLGRHAVPEPSQNDTKQLEQIGSKSSHSQPRDLRPQTANRAPHPRKDTHDGAVLVPPKIATKSSSHSRYDSLSNENQIPMASSAARSREHNHDGSSAHHSESRPARHQWRRKLDPETLQQLQAACYSLGALIEKGLPAQPEPVNPPAPKQSAQKAAPPPTTNHRSRAVSNPPPPGPTVRSTNLPPPGVRLLSSAYSRQEERREAEAEASKSKPSTGLANDTVTQTQKQTQTGVPELSDDSYSTPASMSERGNSTARTSIPASPPKTSSGRLHSRPPPVNGQRSSNRHSRRPSSNIVIPPPPHMPNVTIQQVKDSPTVDEHGHQPQTEAAPKKSLRKLSSQIFKPMSRKSHRNLRGEASTRTSESRDRPPTTWRSAINGLRTRASRVSLRDNGSSVNVNSADAPPVPVLNNSLRQNNDSIENVVSQQAYNQPLTDQSSRPTTAYGRAGDAHTETSAVPGQPEKGFRPFSTIKNGLRKSRSSIFLRPGTSSGTAPPVPAMPDTINGADPAPSVPQSGRLRKMMSVLQFSHPNSQAREAPPMPAKGVLANGRSEYEAVHA